MRFNQQDGYADLPVTIPCGKCNGCRLSHALQWALRCSHESMLHEANCFVTLTYDDDNLPLNKGVPTLRPRDFVLFMKKLRHAHPGVRFFQCGEYGEDTHRPHHHALLFNCAFKDATLWRRKPTYNIYRSAELEQLWPHGHSEIGDVNFTTASYVARYQTAKRGKTLEGQLPEYLTMSRRPGIGKNWLETYSADIYPADKAVTSNGAIQAPPRYYRNLLQQKDPTLHQTLKARRIAYALTHDTSEHRTAREKIIAAKFKRRQTV